MIRLAKKLILAIVVLAAFSGITYSQVTAVMEVKVKVISGAGITASESKPVILNDQLSGSEEFNSGSFSLVSAPNTEVNVRVEKQSFLKNTAGETADFETRAHLDKNPQSGTYNVSYSSRLDEKTDLRGNYNGNVKAVVEYL